MSPALTVVRYLQNGERLGVLQGHVVRDAGPAPPGGFVPSADAWRALRPDGPELPLEGLRLLPPLDPPAVICIGLNYRDHAAESGLPSPAAPLVFAKLVSSVTGPGDPIVVPAHENEPDFEAELALVLGQEARDLPPGRELDAVGGYTALNDVSGRSAQMGDGQWTRGKSFDTFCPLGPAIRSADGVDWDALSVVCEVSGERMQDGNTRDLIFAVPALLGYLSRQFTLLPGTVVATGTPAGVGFGRTPQRWLRDGDVVDVQVGELPPLRNPVVRAQAS
jgi:2-keto-4-pentenoate hydratase/2-oxohepta-3-ene-1,7-dioic acid hydratase in catechol pathway